VYDIEARHCELPAQPSRVAAIAQKANAAATIEYQQRLDTTRSRRREQAALASGSVRTGELDMMSAGAQRLAGDQHRLRRPRPFPVTR
jgi:hypothetical protein